MRTLHQEANAGVTYHRPSYMHDGGWYSFETGLNPGDVRVINGILSKVFRISPRGLFRKPQVHWVSVDPEALRFVPVNERLETEAK